MKVEYEWKCPGCGHGIIEEVMSGVTQTSTVKEFTVDESGSFYAEYMDTSCEGGDTGTIRYQCQKCGKAVPSPDIKAIARKEGV